MRLRGISANTPKRKILRQLETPAEKLLWRHLRAKQLFGLKFRRQHGIGPFIVDFYCDAARLIVELDGAIHDSLEAQEYDVERQAFLEENGYKVIRFPNDDIEINLQGVLARIRDHCTPSSHGGG